MGAFLKVFFAALRAPFFAVFAFAPRVAIGKPLEKFGTTTLLIIGATLRYTQCRSLAAAASRGKRGFTCAARGPAAIVDETLCIAEPTSATIHFQPGVDV
ncbi:MAG: hypothetical protein ACJ8BE_24355 [Microvirga sp.]